MKVLINEAVVANVCLFGGWEGRMGVTCPCQQRYCDLVHCSKYGSKTRISPKIDPLPASRTHSFHRGHLEKDRRLNCFPGVLLSLLNRDSSANCMHKKTSSVDSKVKLGKSSLLPVRPPRLFNLIHLLSEIQN